MESQPSAIDPGLLSRAVLRLFEEGYLGPEDSRGTWFVDNEPDCGFLGTLDGLTAAEASLPLPPSGGATVASHAGHLRFALSLANRAAAGEDAYSGVDWAQSWGRDKVNGEEWAELKDGLRHEVQEFRRVIESGRAFSDEEFLTGTLAVVAHGAWHLGAIRQGLGRVQLPR